MELNNTTMYIMMVLVAQRSQTKKLYSQNGA